MPLKKGVVTKIQKGIDKTIYDFLKQHSDEVFSENEIIKLVQDKGLVPARGKYEERWIPVKAALARLIVNGKVQKYIYNGEEYFGIKA